MTQYIFIGTYTQTSRDTHRPEGIYVFQVNPQNETLEPLAPGTGVKNPSFLAIHPNKRFLYAVEELHEGQAAAFSLTPNGKLTFLNHQPAHGSATCYLTVDPTGKWLLVSNYGSGSLVVFPIQEDGSLGPSTDLILHHGQGPDAPPQEAARAHSVIFDPDGKYVLAADLGLDQVFVYRLDQNNGKLIAHTPLGLKTKTGAGPRHMAFHPTTCVFYVANELNSTVTVCAWDATKGELLPIQNFSTLPANFKGKNSVADIHITPSGRFLFVSNRGHNSLAVFRVSRNGKLTHQGYVPTGGECPRNFAILPPGDRILVANQFTNNLVDFNIPFETGLAKPNGKSYSVPLPVCVLPVYL
jgi:6-phosphogluconolactonase